MTDNPVAGDLSSARSLIEVFRSGVSAHPDREAVVMVTDPDHEDDTATFTYAQLDVEASSVAAQLRDTCRPGDRVLLVYPSGLELVAAFLGCLYAGVIAVPAPFPGRREHRQERRRLTGMVANAEAMVVLTREGDRPAVQQWLTDEGLDHVRCHSTDRAEPHSRTHDQVVFDAGPDTIAFLQYTSGSTGDPRGVILRHRELTSNIEVMARMMRLRGSGLRMCSWLPLHHDMGLIGTVLSPLALGGTSILLDPGDFLRKPYVWLRTMDRFRATSSAAPSFAYDLCNDRVSETEVAQLDLSSVERLGNGSDKINSATMITFLERFAATGLRPDVFIPSYGLAEATLAVSAKVGYDPTASTSGPDLDSDTSGGRQLPVTCGPAPYFDLRIVDPITATVMEDGQEGEVWLRGPGVSPGYWRREEETKETFGGFTADGEGPFLRTGDLGLLHAGELYVTGRIKDVIVARGHKIFPQDIELELRTQHPELNGTSAIFALAAEEEQNAGATIAVHEIGEGDPDLLRALAHDVMHTAAKEFGLSISTVVFVEPGSIPLTSSGKVKRSETRDLYAAGTLRPIYSHSS